MDDTMPFNEENNLLLPATVYEIELWPMLLSKAIIKLANTRYVSSSHFWFVKSHGICKKVSRFSINGKYILLKNFVMTHMHFSGGSHQESVKQNPL